jgi:AraC-like DNA-binding protein
MQIPLAGHARTIVGGEQSNLDIAHYYVTSADRASRLEFGSDFQQLFLRVERKALQDKLTALLGFRPKGRLSFATVLDVDKVQLGGLTSLIGFTAEHLASTSGLSEPPVLMTRQLQETLVVAFLESVPHTFSDLLQGDPLDIGASQVRAVEDYIDGNWMRPITAEYLAEVTGIGARSIFRSFQRYRTHTPLQYVKMVRLDHANLLLRSPSEGTGVTGVAFQCGFSNPGHFAKDYQDRFGELPSVTLAKSK